MLEQLIGLYVLTVILVYFLIYGFTHDGNTNAADATTLIKYRVVLMVIAPLTLAASIAGFFYAVFGFHDKLRKAKRGRRR